MPGPNGESIAIPASEPGTTVKFWGISNDVARSNQAGASGSAVKFTYFSGNGGIYEGTAVSVGPGIGIPASKRGGGAGAGGGISYGLSPSTDQFFGTTLNLNFPSSGFSSSGFGLNGSRGNVSLFGSFGQGISLRASLTNTFLLGGGVTFVGCWN